MNIVIIRYLLSYPPNELRRKRKNTELKRELNQNQNTYLCTKSEESNVVVFKEVVLWVPYDFFHKYGLLEGGARSCVGGQLPSVEDRGRNGTFDHRKRLARPVMFPVVLAEPDPVFNVSPEREERLDGDRRTKTHVGKGERKGGTNARVTVNMDTNERAKRRKKEHGNILNKIRAEKMTERYVMTGK